MTHPNILFLITDQQRADHVGFGGNGVVQTPHLDALAARGTVFERACVANPVCMPNRSTIMTGRMPSAHGTRFNGISLDWRANTFVRRLAAAGYRTTHIGKSHLQNMAVGRGHIRELVDFTLAEEALLPAGADGWDTHENFERYRAGESPDVGDFYGFERAAFAILHGDQVTGHYGNWLREQGVDWRAVSGPGNALARFEDWLQVYQTALPVELYPSTWVGDRTVGEIHAAAADGRPFFIHASWPDPHHPFTPPGDYWGMYAADDMPLSPSFDDPHTDSMPHYRRMLERRGTPGHPVDGWAPTARQLRAALAAQYGNISLIDDNVGRILAALDDAGVADDTIVVFTSDHGDMFGDHGVLLKHAMHYNGCLHVPLVIARPGDAGKRTAALAGSIDIAPTLLDLAGVTGYHGMQGVSLASVLDNPEARVRNHVLVEEDEPGDMTGAGVPTRIRTLVTDDGRLSRYLGHTHGELFASDDALEMTNLFGKPSGAELEHHLGERLLQAILQHANESPRPTHTA